MHLVVDHEAARDIEGHFPLLPEGLRPAHHVGGADADSTGVQPHGWCAFLCPRTNGTCDGQSPVERHPVHLLVLAEYMQIIEIDIAALTAMLKVVCLYLCLAGFFCGLAHVHLLQRRFYRLPRCRLCRRSIYCARHAEHSCHQKGSCMRLFHCITSSAYIALPRCRGGRESSLPSYRQDHRASWGDDKTPARRA